MLSVRHAFSVCSLLCAQLAQGPPQVRLDTTELIQQSRPYTRLGVLLWFTCATATVLQLLHSAATNVLQAAAHGAPPQPTNCSYCKISLGHLDIRRVADINVFASIGVAAKTKASQMQTNPSTYAGHTAGSRASRLSASARG